jgi:hypothetical protein
METTASIKDNVKEYIDTKIDIIKLKAINQGGAAVSNVIVGVALAFLGIFIIMFLSFSAAYAISTATEKPYLGFLIVAGFYILLAVLVVVLKDKLLTMPIINSLLEKFYYKNSEKKESVKS